MCLHTARCFHPCSPSFRSLYLVAFARSHVPGPQCRVPVRATAALRGRALIEDNSRVPERDQSGRSIVNTARIVFAGAA